jgi:DNA-directed RNA polymerase specialized sigma24 family protein
MSPRTAHDEIDIHRAAALLTAVQRGRTDALVPLLQMVEPFIRRRARTVARDDDLVDDIVQEVWILLSRRAGCIRDPQALIAWLGIVTVRRGLRLRATSGRLVATSFPADVAAAASTEDDALARCAADTIKAGIDRALDGLGADQRALITLLTAQERPEYAAISRAVGRPVGSLGPSRQRLLDKLRRDPNVARLGDLATAS